ncbi:MAG: hypothetical protein D6732_15575 [Methanobacteriota archaeon]|nr:MAG: hypothetical protein D6732_15575 [Euryarchaeota archaeon]
MIFVVFDTSITIIDPFRELHSNCWIFYKILQPNYELNRGNPQLNLKLSWKKSKNDFCFRINMATMES